MKRFAATLAGVISAACVSVPDSGAPIVKAGAEPADAVALSYDSVNFDLTIDRGYHDLLLKRYLEAGLIKQAPSESELKTLYQTDLSKH